MTDTPPIGKETVEKFLAQPWTTTLPTWVSFKRVRRVEMTKTYSFSDIKESISPDLRKVREDAHNYGRTYNPKVNWKDWDLNSQDKFWTCAQDDLGIPRKLQIEMTECEGSISCHKQELCEACRPPSPEKRSGPASYRTGPSLGRKRPARLPEPR